MKLIEAIKFYNKIKKVKKEVKKILADAPAKEVKDAVDKWIEATLNLGNVFEPFKDIALDLIELVKNVF